MPKLRIQNENMFKVEGHQISKLQFCPVSLDLCYLCLNICSHSDRTEEIQVKHNPGLPFGNRSFAIGSSRCGLKLGVSKHGDACRNNTHNPNTRKAHPNARKIKTNQTRYGMKNARNQQTEPHCTESVIHLKPKQHGTNMCNYDDIPTHGLMHTRRDRELGCTHGHNGGAGRCGRR